MQRKRKQAMSVRHVRMPDALWDDVLTLADARGTYAADEVREALEARTRRFRALIARERAVRDADDDTPAHAAAS